MAMKTSHKWMIVVGAIIVLLIMAWFIYKSIPKSQGGGATDTTTTTSNPGLLELASGFLGGSWIKNILGGGGKGKNYCKDHPNDIVNCNASNDCYNGCKSSAPGYNCEGILDSNC